MIFINTRPLDESIHDDRRPSKAPSHHSVHSEPRKLHMNRVVLCLLVFYIVVSAVLVLLHYPLSLVALLVPCIVFLYAICTIRSGNRSDQWPCCLVAIFGILVKIAAIIVYILIFPVKDVQKKSSALPVRLQARANVSLDQHRMIFFVVLIVLDVFVLAVGACLKWHLIAFEKLDISVQKRSIERSSVTATSNHPLILENRSSRTNVA